MNKKAPEYLSYKRIVLLSLIISLGFHLIMFMAIFFGQTQFSAEDTKMMRHHSFNFWWFFYFFSISFIMVFLILIYNRKVLSYPFRKKYISLIFIILGSIIISVVFSIGFVYTKEAFLEVKHRPEMLYNIMRDSLVRDLTITAVTILVVQLEKLRYTQKTIAVENEALKSENLLTRFEALKSQLDPHFLFNSLNTLQSLIGTDNEKAENYLQQLSTVLRYTLQNKEVITLDDEMKCVHSYCDMMQIRYGENLKFEFDIDEKYSNYKVLPLSIQSLVENAVKHNVISSKQPLLVTIASSENSVAVANPIQKKATPEEGNGIGLVNLSERYRLKWDKEVEITNDGVTFCVRVPLIKID